MIKFITVWFILSVILLLFNIITNRIIDYTRHDKVLQYIEDILLLPVVVLGIIIGFLTEIYYDSKH